MIRLSFIAFVLTALVLTPLVAFLGARKVELARFEGGRADDRGSAIAVSLSEDSEWGAMDSVENVRLFKTDSGMVSLKVPGRRSSELGEDGHQLRSAMSSEWGSAWWDEAVRGPVTEFFVTAKVGAWLELSLAGVSGAATVDDERTADELLRRFAVLGLRDDVEPSMIQIQLSVKDDRGTSGESSLREAVVLSRRPSLGSSAPPEEVARAVPVVDEAGSEDDRERGDEE